MMRIHPPSKIRPAAWRLVAVLVLAMPPAAAWGWAEAGHMAVAQIAHDRLTPAVRSETDRLIAVLADFEPRFDDFVTASVWLDAVRAAGWRSYDRWHYVNLPFNAEGLPDVPAPAEDNAVEAVRQAVAVLSNPRAPDLAKAIMLRTLVHVVADLHQPLHCVNRFSLELPAGDQGGGAFQLPAEDGGNLHRLWDSTLGLLPDLAADAAGRARIAEWAAEMTAAVPEHLLVGQTIVDPEIWAREGFALATTAVYVGVTPNRPVPELYRVKGQLVVRRRLVLAGLRLAAVLESALAAAGQGGGAASQF